MVRLSDRQPSEVILPRLEGVKQTARGRWLARCPAHDDRRPSLSIREADDGRLLIHCFAGCGAANVVAAIGLDLADLFPPDDAWAQESAYGPRQTKGRYAPPRPSAADALKTLDEEVLVVEIIASELAGGKPVEEYRDDLLLAASRISSIYDTWRLGQ